MATIPFTLLDITNQLRSYFTSNTLFTTEEFPAVTIPQIFASDRDLLISTALDELIDEGLVRKMGEKSWILSRPIGGEGQQVGLSLNTCVSVAEVINTYLRAQGVENDHSDAGNIGEEDVVMLLRIIATLLNVDPSAGAN